MFDHLKPRKTYRIFAAVSFCIAAIYGILQMTCLRRKQSKHERSIEEAPKIYNPVGIVENDAQRLEDSDEQSPLSKEEDQMEKEATDKTLTSHAADHYRDGLNMLKS